MGGICAAIGVNAGHVANEMCRCLGHRGPDDEGKYTFGDDIALGHRALFAEHSAREHQPLSNEDETVWITFDGAIYNFEELRMKLGRNHNFRSESSAELVIHAYEEEDEECLKKLNGDFAFCLWDSQKRILFSARDRIGVRPLYYFVNFRPFRFLASSEIKALLVDHMLPREPNQDIIYEYLLNGPHRHTGNTFFNGIKELLPAHFVLVDHNDIRVQKYWSPLCSSETSAIRGERHTDHVSAFLELFRDSIRIRVPRNSLIGTFLSGGIDSTSVACVLYEILRSNLSTLGTRQELYSAVYPNAETDERKYAEEVAHALCGKLNYVHPTVSEHWGDIEKFVYYMDEPIPVFNYYAYWCLARMASRRVRVTFSGQGPDEILGGHAEERIAYYKELWKGRRILRLLVELIGTLTQYKIGKLLQYDLKGLLLRDGRKGEAIKRLLAQEHRAFALPKETLNEAESLNQTLLKETTQTLLLDHLQFGDRTSSAFSIETRYPFLDYRIVKFAFSLPSNEKIRNGWTKCLLRRAMKDMIPEPVRKRRGKLGTPIPLENWLVSLKREVREIFESRQFRERGYFNQQAILDTYDRFCDHKIGRSKRAFYADVFWRILNLEIWFRIFFDPPRKPMDER